MAKKFKNFINGKWVDAQSGRTFENHNPAHWEEIVGIFPKSGREDVNEAVKAALAQYGMLIGLAFQTVDDILDFSSNSRILGKPVVSDLKEGKVTLPLVYAMEQCTPAEARLIETVLREREFKTVSQKEILSLVDKYQTVEKARSLARRFAAEAHSALQLFPKSPFKEALEAIP